MEFYEAQVHPDAYVNAQIKQPGKQVMFLTADWCGDCKAIKPFVGDYKTAVEQKGLTWVDADRDENIEIAKTYGLRGIPAFVLFEDGELVRHIGNGERLNPKDVSEWIAAV
ncbi:MAG: thioredoxin family protein [Lactobacillaceae bacterium]|jgi:thiol-disulfide isomerase/thioredoxin|nr:thioredoxin family protein [Lactobacillaceae bacterium]